MSAQPVKHRISGIVGGLIGLCMAASANASLIGVKTIEISNALGTWLQVAEFQAFDGSNTNVALGATASAGTTWNGFSTPNKAIDGNTDGNFSNQSVYHDGTQGDTLVISLAAATDLSSITIFGRTDCCSDRDIYNLDFLNASGESIFLLSSLDASGASNQASFRLPSAPVAVPEPGMLALFGLGLAGLALLRRRTR